jgi:hypothetical protein
VRVEIEGEDIIFDDNYFDIDGGSTKKILFGSKCSLGELRKKLRFRWL